jgi:hypothetical protein
VHQGTRIAISGSTDALAFKNPDDTIVAEVYNKAASSTTTIVGVAQRHVSVRHSSPRVADPSRHWGSEHCGLGDGDDDGNDSEPRADHFVRDCRGLHERGYRRERSGDLGRPATP